MRRAWVALVVLTLSLSWAYAQPEAQHQGLPVIRNGHAPISSDPITLDAGDNTYLGATLSTTGLCVFVAFVDRDGGNKVIVKQDAGDRLVNVTLPPDTKRALEGIAPHFPSYEAPGDKQAMGVPLAWRRSDGAAILSLYYTTRDEGDEAGSFKLKRLDMPEPACQF